MELRDVIKRRKAYEARFAQQQVVFKGIICEQDSSTEVPNTPDYYWVQPNATGELVAVFNRNVKGIRVGLGVVCGFEPYSSTLEVLRFDESMVAGITEVGYLNVPNHAKSHLIDGDDPLPIYDNAIFILATYTLGASGLAVSVSPYVYEKDGALVVFPGEDGLSLTAYQPAAGLARYVLIYLALATNTLAFVAGETTIDSPIYTPTPPAIPDNCVPSALVRLDGSQTVVAPADIISVRDFLYGASRARAEITGDFLHRLAVQENEMDKILNRHLVQGW